MLAFLTQSIVLLVGGLHRSLIPAQEVRINPQEQFCGVCASGSVLKWCSWYSDVKETHISKNKEGLQKSDSISQTRMPQRMGATPMGSRNSAALLPGHQADTGSVTQAYHVFSGYPGPVFQSLLVSVYPL